jgi:hypothetical protein
MGILPRSKLNDYYEQFKAIDVVFSKEIIGITGLVTKMVNLKCFSDFFPCVIYSTTFEYARVVANRKSGILEKLETSNNVLSLRYCFKLPSSGEQVAFLVPARVLKSESYNGSPEMSIFTLQFSQRPPDDLIEIMGRILEANYFYSKYKMNLFPVSPELLRKTRLANKDMAIVQSEGQNCACVIRQLGFGAAHLVAKGVPQSILDKTLTLRFDFEEPQESVAVEGICAQFEYASNQLDMAVMVIAFGGAVPMTYKVRLSDYVTTLRLDSQKKAAEDRAGQEAKNAAQGDADGTAAEDAAAEPEPETPSESAEAPSK